VTPNEAKGDSEGEISVAENPNYLQERTATITVTADDFTAKITVTQSPQPCPDFAAGSIASAGEILAAGGTPGTINSVQGATGGREITYQWYKGGDAINGATAASYTPPAADAAMAGAYMYTRHAKNDACNTAFTQSAGSWTLTVIACNFDAGAIATAGETICSGNMANTITSSTDASGGDGNITYEWRRNGIDMGATNAAAYNPSAYITTIGAHTFTRWAKDGSCNTAWTQSAGQWVLEVTGHPQLMLTTGNNNQAVMSGTAIAPIQYVAANATGITLTGGSFPSGISGVWNLNTYTISGTPTSAGIFNYTLSTTNSNGCPNAAASGAITVNAETTTPPETASTNTWTFGSQTWSDRVVATPSNCTQTDNLSISDYPAAAYRVYDGRYYYNWTCAYNNRESFCPSPWRIPADDDFNVLINNTTNMTLMYIWGYGGFANGSSLTGVSSEVYYWSSTVNSGATSYAYSLSYYSGGLGVYSTRKYYGFQVRCVK
jgi:uncharacterized protein (TIGR02145 family)